MHFLVPTDFSAPSRTAFLYAVELARQCSGRITLLHTYSIDFGMPIPSVATVQMLEARRHAGRTGLQDLIQSVDLQGVEVESRSEMGIPWDSIVKTAADLGCHAIVMGTKGEHNVAETLFGSVTTHVMHSANCPVWVIPEGAAPAPVQRIAYATSLQEGDLDHILPVINLARCFGASVHCVHINTDKLNDKLEAAVLEEFVQVQDPQIRIDFTQIEHNSIREGLEQFVDENKIDLLALLRPQRSFFERIFRRSQTRNFALHGKVPLYIFKD